MSAVFSGDPTLIDYLLKQNVAFNVRANNGWTALFYATELLQPDIARTLLEQGADPNITGLDGFSPLMSAVLNGSYPLVEILLESGADPNLKDINNESAFSIAEDKNEEEILGLLEKAKS
jgi:ankyrin repeat protein